jgi:hypothetical protein
MNPVTNPTLSIHKGTWGLYPWFPEHGPDAIHPEDLISLLAHPPYGKLFECVGNDGEFLSLKCHDNDFAFRAKPILFKSVPPPPVQVGDIVTVISKGSQKTATISGMGWHFKKNEHIFVLTIEGKPASKRYWLADFI